MNITKQILAAFLAVLIAVSLCACGGANVPETGNNTNRPSEGQNESIDTQPETDEIPEQTETDPIETSDQEEKPYETVSLKDAKVGDVVVFGSYELDGDTANGSEPLEWLVLSDNADSLLLITLYGIERMQFNNSLKTTTWETSYLRTWLNSDFIDATFSASEKSQIKTVDVIAEPNPEYPRLPAGNDTEDRIFVLNNQEVELYFKDTQSRICAPSDAVVAATSGIYSHTGKKTWYSNKDYLCSWWLRSPALFKDLYVSYVSPYGQFAASQVYIENTASTGTDFCIRPAMWITRG